MDVSYFLNCLAGLGFFALCMCLVLMYIVAMDAYFTGRPVLKPIIKWLQSLRQDHCALVAMFAFGVLALFLGWPWVSALAFFSFCLYCERWL